MALEVKGLRSSGVATQLVPNMQPGRSLPLICAVGAAGWDNCYTINVAAEQRSVFK
jgi:hypothetical protein